MYVFVCLACNMLKKIVNFSLFVSELLLPLQHDAMKVAKAKTKQSSSRYGSNQVFLAFFLLLKLLKTSNNRNETHSLTRAQRE